MGRDPEVPGASALDLIAHLSACLAPGEARQLETQLRVLEWMPRLALLRSGFCWLPLPERRAFLQRLAVSPVRPLRRRVKRLRQIVDSSHAAAARDQASSAPA